MNTAIVVPVGYVDRMGYQHVFQECQENWKRSADKVLIMETLPRFGRTPDGSPWFDAFIVMEAVNDGLALARERGMDAALVLMCNNYVCGPELLSNVTEAMLMAGTPFARYYRADQLADQMFGPSVRLPWLVNLRRGRPRLSVDCLVMDGAIYRMERGEYAEPPLVVDVQLEMTREELADKMNFIRCYADLVPKRKPTFEWAYWLPYYVDKFRQKRRRPDMPLTETGKAIAQDSRPDFVSWKVLECL